MKVVIPLAGETNLKQERMPQSTPIAAFFDLSGVLVPSE